VVLNKKEEGEIEMTKKIIVSVVLLAVTFMGGFTAGSNTGINNAGIIAINSQLKLGTSPGNIALSLEKQRESLTEQGIDVDALIKHVWSGLETTPDQL